VSATGTAVRRIGVFSSSAGHWTVGRTSPSEQRDVIDAEPAHLARGESGERAEEHRDA
jgi:hypothetical protein